MGDKRKNVKVSAETHEKLRRKKPNDETWDEFLSRCVEIDSIMSIREYLQENMGEDRPDRDEVIDVFISTRGVPSYAYWEVMASEDSHPAEFSLLVHEAIETALSEGDHPGKLGLVSMSSPAFLEDAAIETWSDFDGLYK